MTASPSSGPAVDPLRGVTLRPKSDADHLFLLRLYASTRAEELARVPWSDEQKGEFIAFQFDAQSRYYDEQFPSANFDLVLLDGKAIGRFYIDERDDEFRVVDIAFLPDARGRGIGGALMQRIIQRGKKAKKLVRIHVERENPAMRLYLRLGFEKIEEQGVYDLMEKKPS